MNENIEKAEDAAKSYEQKVVYLILALNYAKTALSEDAGLTKCPD